jgi:hypothetical protein
MGNKHSRGSARRRAFAAVAVVACVLALAPVAVAASNKGSILSTYGGSSRPLVAIGKPKGDGIALPNTGLDVAFVIAGGAAIGLLGFGLRRLARQKT